MSTPVDNSLTGLKASTAQIMAIISGTWQIPLCNSYFSLKTQAQVIKDYGSGPLPGIVLSCSKELLHVWGMTPQVWPNWHNIGYDDPHLLMHIWHPKLLAWEALGLIPVDFPSPPIHASNVASPSTDTTTEFWDKGKGKAIDADLEPKAEGSWKRKSPMISGLSSQPPKSAMKTCKHVKSSCWVMSKPLVDSEDEEDMGIQPFSGGVLEVILPQLFNSPRSPWVPTKKPFGPATVIASSHLAVIKPSQLTPKSPVEAPPVINGGDILIPGPNNPCQVCTKLKWPCATQLDKRTGNPCQVHPSNYGYPAKTCLWVLYHPEHKVQDALQGSLHCSPHLPIQGLDSQSVSWQVQNSGCRGCDNPQDPDVWSQQDHHCWQGTLHQLITLLSLSSAVPAPAPSLAVPAAALDLLMLDLHAMAIAIWDGTARITILEAHVAEQDEMTPAPPKFEDAFAIEGLLFEYNWVVQPELPDTSSKNADPGDLGNLVPEYDSSNDMDVEVKVEASSEEVDMAI
ncbi:uncharacterized protein BJ212DRAFT_1304341 [Suillus subaureus]|uniref:Uncharacterized protein n=1 Tax=Suillus subaureus TaxID=48587 RepID=A0A9P7DVL2_9AGAM|nr:uncharacterized protein BJ212DRAFT_1304341 [Suillus subaureus]KAG1804322.1 hypothetical protein BJ212DRAFT_1304341 [Suillus subaureus]